MLCLNNLNIVPWIHGAKIDRYPLKFMLRRDNYQPWWEGQNWNSLRRGHPQRTESTIPKSSGVSSSRKPSLAIAKWIGCASSTDSYCDHLLATRALALAYTFDPFSIPSPHIVYFALGTLISNLFVLCGVISSKTVRTGKGEKKNKKGIWDF